MTRRQPTPAERLYLNPLGPQFYPPLGFADDGTPRHTPGPPGGRPANAPPDGGRRGGGPPAAAARRATPGPVSHRIDRRSDTLWKTTVYVVAIVVLGAATLLMARNMLTDDTPDEITLPSVDSDDTWITDTQAPYTRMPDVPSRRGTGIDATGKAVVYRVTVTGVGVLAYSDGVGTRSDVVSEPEWSVAFTGTSSPLRLLVVGTSGSAVSCSISVDGEVVATDRVAAESDRRTATCLA